MVTGCAPSLLDAIIGQGTSSPSNRAAACCSASGGSSPAIVGYCGSVPPTSDIPDSSRFGPKLTFTEHGLSDLAVLNPFFGTVFNPAIILPPDLLSDWASPKVKKIPLDRAQVACATPDERFPVWSPSCVEF